MSDEIKLMQYKLKKKSMVLAYIFNVFFSGLGMHRFYMRRYKSAVTMLLINVIGIFLMCGGVLFVFLISNETTGINLLLACESLGSIMVTAVAIWAIVDLFLVHLWVKAFNCSLIEELDL